MTWFESFLGAGKAFLFLVGCHHGQDHLLAASSALLVTWEGPKYLEDLDLFHVPDICVSSPYLHPRNPCANVWTPPPVVPRVLWRVT